LPVSGFISCAVRLILAANAMTSKQIIFFMILILNKPITPGSLYQKHSASIAETIV
jgi:hypothetical protein